jgi:hypothetical protein
MQLFLFYLYLAIIDDVVEGLQFTACGSDIVWTSDQVFQQHNIISTAAGARTFLKQFGFAPHDGASSDAASAKQWHHPLFTAQHRDLRQLVELPREFWVSSSSQNAAKTPASQSRKAWFAANLWQFLIPGGYFSFSSAPTSPQRSSPRRVRSVRAVTCVQPVPLATVTPAFSSDAAANREALSVDEALQWCETFGRGDSSAMQRKASRTARAVKRVRVLSRRARRRLRDKRTCSNSKSATSVSSNSNSNSSSRSSRIAGVTGRAVKSLRSLSQSFSARLNDSRLSGSSGSSDSINSTSTTSTSDCSSNNNNNSSSGSSGDIKCSCLVQ